MDEVKCCSTKIKHRTNEEHKKLMNRLSRIEGQVRGIKNMVEEDRYCIDILTQVSAVQAAISSFSKELLSDHVRTCIVKDIRDDQMETVEELVQMMQKLMK